jgi:uncharacterized protein (DUF885 family)
VYLLKVDQSMRCNCIIGLVVALLLTPIPTGVQAATPAESLNALLEEAWEFELDEDPLFATQVGDRRGNAKLPRVTVEEITRRNEARKGFLGRLQKIDRGSLSRADQINYDIFERLTRDQVEAFGFQSYLQPITNRSGFHIDFPELPREVPLTTREDYENYVSRLNAFPQYARENIDLMRAGIQAGLVLPAVALEGYRQPIEAQIVDDPTESLLYGPFTKFPAGVSEEDRERLSEAAKKAIAEGVIPTYRGFLEFMQKEYMPRALGEIGCAALPNGRAYYRYLVRHFTTLDITPEQVHEIGLAEVKRIQAEMMEVIRKTGFEGTFAEFVEYLRKDPKFYAETPEELLKEVSFVLKRMDGLLPQLFGKLPRMPYGIREVPAYIAPQTTTAYYFPPAGDGTRAGFFYVNTYDLKTRPLFEIEALSLHEAVPGHHLQIALQQEMEDMPPFRRFHGFTAMVEGWGLYAERLGLEVGFYEDPYRDFGRLSYEMWRACRLVVDTGMHYLGWSRQQAIDFMKEHTALTLHNITTEVDRYISWPGQALAYKMGELKIRDLRAQAEKELGEKFDVRAFHDVVLGSGSVPLSVLEENVRAYIDQTRREG